METEILLNNVNIKQDALIEASNEIFNGLKNVTELFKNFQEKWFSLLDDQKKLNVHIKNSEKHDSTTRDIFPTSQLNLDINPQLNAVNDVNLSQETPGVVESTQFDDHISLRLKNQHSETLKKLQNCFFASKKPSENPTKPSKSEINVAKNSGKLILSQVDSKTNVSASGKISRQTKLVLQPVNKKIEDNRSSKNTKKVNEVDFVDLDIDATLFEQPFTQEQIILEENANNLSMQDEVIETSLIRSKYDKKFSTKFSPKRSSHETTKKYEVKAPVWPLKTWGLGTSKKEPPQDKKKSNEDYKKLWEKIPSFDCSSDETFFAGEDSTSPSKKIEKTPKKVEDNANINKRKYSITAGPSKAKENTITEIDLDIGSISDWESDMSCDKWTKTPPKKKILMDSFDVLPKKAKEAPKFAFKGPVVRNKAERAKLRGWDCKDCEKYYQNLNLPEAELQKRKDQCSRHRSKFNERYQTPPGFWDYKFPDTVSSSQE